MLASSARQSSVSTGMQGPSSGQSRLQAKRQELEGLQILKEQSARLAKDVETLSQGIDQLIDGGEGEIIGK
jgi:DASH complex subunit DAD2